jgi:hypothetical protein
LGVVLNKKYFFVTLYDCVLCIRRNTCSHGFINMHYFLTIAQNITTFSYREDIVVVLSYLDSGIFTLFS